MNAKDKARAIVKHIRHADKKVRARFSWLRHQSFIGLGIFTLSCAGMVAASWGWIAGVYPFWAMVLTNAFLASLLHELEHDLIHSLYFKDTWVEKLMMWGVWVFRGNTPSPFYRKKIHLLHHKDSGQFSDIEEQMIGNGMKMGLKRLIVMIDQNLAFLLNVRKVAETSPELNIREMFRASIPFHMLFTITLNTVLLGTAGMWLQSQGYLQLPLWFIEMYPYFVIAGAVWVLPNFIRQASLQIISSNMHYFGDIEPGREGLIQQCQVLKPWYLIPFQLFCFNFGSTHGIHHFVVNQPFYLRQMIAARAHAAMKRYGVRFNDTKTLSRANRYSLEAVG
ncbi:MAG: fatty acid desaturase [Leptospiraceae bacterium]|nr:fatty acid desaturase [Leptospiraceae bacterium]